MGTDIYMFAEIRDHGRWIYHEPSERFQKAMDLTKAECHMPIFQDRVYSAFSVLAGVRDDVRIEKPVAPISPPKGKPNDFCPEIARELLSCGSDAHDISWLTLGEIQAYDWCQMIGCVGYVDPEYEIHFKHRPKTFPPSVPNVCGFSTRKVKVRWFTTALEAGGRFHSDVIPYLKQLGKPEEVRVVFWFCS